MKCPGGGIGRHAGLKILCPLGRAGSSPARGTQNPVIFWLWDFFYACKGMIWGFGVSEKKSTDIYKNYTS